MPPAAGAWLYRNPSAPGQQALKLLGAGARYVFNRMEALPDLVQGFFTPT